jgi:hypothetical protein
MVSLLLPLGTQMEQRRIVDSRTRLDDASEALIASAIINGLQPDLRLCSDASGISNAGTPSAACAAGKDISTTASVVAIIYSIRKNFAAGALP